VVDSPGGFPTGITVENVLDHQASVTLTVNRRK
jgi:hypothetical protein